MRKSGKRLAELWQDYSDACHKRKRYEKALAKRYGDSVPSVKEQMVLIGHEEKQFQTYDKFKNYAGLFGLS